MGKKIYVGNLPFSTTEAAINEMFAESGSVDSVRLITDRASGQSKGFGFVEMSNDDEALNAISALNGMQMEGRQITVNEARPQEPRTGGFSGGRSHSGGRSGGYGNGGSSSRRPY